MSQKQSDGMKGTMSHSRQSAEDQSVGLFVCLTSFFIFNIYINLNTTEMLSYIHMHTLSSPYILYCDITVYLSFCFIQVLDKEILNQPHPLPIETAKFSYMHCLNIYIAVHTCIISILRSCYQNSMFQELYQHLYTFPYMPNRCGCFEPNKCLQIKYR